MTIDLGDDPDGSGPLDATLVRSASPGTVTAGAVLYVHGFTDYFFNADLAAHFTDRGFAFYALDLRRCGRSMNDHRPHYTTDLAEYDVELTAALDVITAETDAAGAPRRIVVAAHSTGGLTTSLWLDRLRRTDADRHRSIGGLLLNSPWFDLQGEPVLRTAPVGWALRALAAVSPTRELPRELSGAYGESLHASAHGRWSYDLRLKPLGGFPVTFGWIAAVREGHRRLHRGIDIGVPALVLRSDRTRFAGHYTPDVDTADCVLDVRQIAQWSGALGRRVWAVAVPGARHDVFLSLDEPRRRAYAEVDTWLDTDIVPPVSTDGAVHLEGADQ
ncbi:alpha/beta hydrolase [Gordonia shandongensis]|uniref:alpha/beta hydrolase n=1 Tax=Gordonia shandongensis TaxID=376351 RepID=UPI0009FC0C1E|nr:alpha/beta hydrolase [Gordonia shandongensis]